MNERPDLVAEMAFDPLLGVIDLESHLAAMKDEAARLDYGFDRHGLRNELQAATFRLRGPATIRLLVGSSGAVAIEVVPA